VAQQFEVVIVEQVKNIFPPAGKEVIKTDNVMAFAHESFAKVGTDKARAAGYQDSHEVLWLPKGWSRD
jgi:hypothetical protein